MGAIIPVPANLFQNYAYNKTVLVAGTSIPAGVAPRIYPNIIGQKLNIIVKNQAIAGTAVRAGQAANANGAMFTGYISGATLTVTAVRRGTIGVASEMLRAVGITAGTTITAQTSGTTGGVGTYTVNNSQTLYSSGTPGSLYSNTDPFGAAGTAYAQFWLNLAHTIDDKNFIIAYWTSYFANGSVLTGSYPETLTTQQQASIIAASYQSNLIPFAAANMAFTFEHGYNDVWSTGAEIDISHETVVNSRDPLTYFGAANTVRDALLVANPELIIGIQGYYAKDRYPPIVEAQLLLAQYWNCVIARTWEKLRWTQEMITTYGNWSNGLGEAGVWADNVLSSPQTITRLQRALPDNLHPHQDQSGIATDEISNALLSFYFELFTPGRYNNSNGEPNIYFYDLTGYPAAGTFVIPDEIKFPARVRLRGSPTGNFTVLMPTALTNALKGSLIKIMNETVVVATIQGNGATIGIANAASVQLSGNSAEASWVCVEPGQWRPDGYTADSGGIARVGSGVTLFMGGPANFGSYQSFGVNLVASGTNTIPNTFASGMTLLTGTSGCTVNLPSTPPGRGQFFFQDTGGNAATNPMIISGNGKTINGSSATTFAMNVNGGRATAYYDSDVSADWWITMESPTPVSLLKAANLTAQAAAIGSTAIFTPPVSGFYRVSYAASVTTAASVSSTLGPFGLSYTNVSDSAVKTVADVNSTANTTGTALLGSFLVYAKAATAINYTMGYASSLAGMNYDLNITVEAV